ncbi:hypothetical protein C1645_745046 [Glomus cerebriforme]|uniref:Uncharacterized protein n=1 Tax=Glomus cerebriforme TaxID=658196 RepID=A0A397S2S8_9GLOM|nr:hypothetical protein C1645_745046 [Glomus cerebriforme]
MSIGGSSALWTQYFGLRCPFRRPNSFQRYNIFKIDFFFSKFRCSLTTWTDVDFNVQFLGTLDVQDFGRGSQLCRFGLSAALLVKMVTRKKEETLETFLEKTHIRPKTERPTKEKEETLETFL